MRKYNGCKVDFDYDENEYVLIGCSKFVSFGQMADGTTCYHEIINGVEDESCWYSCFRKHGVTCFVLEAIN